MFTRTSCLLRWSVALLAVLAACTSGPTPPVLPESTTVARTAGPAGTGAAVGTAAPAGAGDVAATATAASGAVTVAVPATATVRLWVPEQFRADPKTGAGAVLARRLAEFEASYPDLKIEIRIKRTPGRGGLLDSLAAASTAAPAALPDIVALNRSDLTTAALKGLILPLTDLALAESDFFPFAVELAEVGGVLYGIPFAGEAQMMVYNRLLYPVPPLAWSDVVSGAGPLLIPAGEATGLFTLTQYLAIGGPLRDEESRPMLDGPLLAEVLAFYDDARQAGVLPRSVLETTDATETWRAYREGGVALAATPLSAYLADREQVIFAQPALIPTRDGLSYALAGGWSWALVAGRSGGSPLAEELLAWLSEPAFLGEWTAALNALPTQEGALAHWPAGPSTDFTRQLALAAHLQPSLDLQAVVGPVIREAVEKVLSEQATPQGAAAAAAVTLTPREPPP